MRWFSQLNGGICRRQYKLDPPGQQSTFARRHFHATDTGLAGGELDFGEEKQIVNRFRELPERSRHSR